MGVYVTGDLIYGVPLVDIEEETIAEFLQARGIEIEKVEGYYGPEYEVDLHEELWEWFDSQSSFDISYGGDTTLLDSESVVAIGIKSPKLFFELVWRHTPVSEIEEACREVVVTDEQVAAIKDIYRELMGEENVPEPEWLLMVSRG